MFKRFLAVAGAAAALTAAGGGVASAQYTYWGCEPPSRPGSYPVHILEPTHPICSVIVRHEGRSLDCHVDYTLLALEDQLVREPKAAPCVVGVSHRTPTDAGTPHVRCERAVGWGSGWRVCAASVAGVAGNDSGAGCSLAGNEHNAYHAWYDVGCGVERDGETSRCGAAAGHTWNSSFDPEALSPQTRAPACE